MRTHGLRLYIGPGQVDPPAGDAAGAKQACGLVPLVDDAALWLGPLFHVGIQLSASIDMFSYVMLSGYGLFARPELHERTLLFNPRVRLGRQCARRVPWLDWLSRVRLAP